jgi:hypothetical protein
MSEMGADLATCRTAQIVRARQDESSSIPELGAPLLPEATLLPTPCLGLRLSSLYMVKSADTATSLCRINGPVRKLPHVIG